MIRDIGIMVLIIKGDNMRKFAVCALHSVVLLLAVSATAWGAEKKAEPQYVGATKCKVCHMDEHKSWLETKHAKAFDVLSDEEKKKPECVGCHITGKTGKGELLEGVQCEACHGPGSEYKSMEIMNKKRWAADPEKHQKMAVEAGLIYPKEENCTRCHKKEGNPNFKKFEFAKRKPLVHPMQPDTTSAGEAAKPAPKGTQESKPADTTSKK